MYSGPRLVELLEKQHQARSQAGLFKKDTFTIQWRAKVGSFPHPDIETLVSAGEPCGSWIPNNSRPEEKRNVDQNNEQLPELPLHGYLPGSAIRGLVRAWAKKHNIQSRMHQLLGYQTDETIRAGKIEFLDAWPQQATKLTLDIVNPQQSFQVYHEGQSTPLSFYTLGDGKDPVLLTVAISGIPGRATEEEVEEVWGWVQQALSLSGVGSRTASGYGALKPASPIQTTPEPGHSIETLQFSLYSQGCAGPRMREMELRPSHWRGWLRSWVLRFLLGVMSKEDAEKTVGELLGTIEPEARQGCVRLKMIPGQTWGSRSRNNPHFYAWEGTLQLSAPTEILKQIVLPIVRFAASVGGVGRGWRRPLHVFRMNNDREATRGTHLIITQRVRNQNTDNPENQDYGLPPHRPKSWSQVYDKWLAAVQTQWQGRVSVGANNQLAAEVFSPTTCAIYAVPGPDRTPIDRREMRWENLRPEDMRGDGTYLIYRDQRTRNYKRNPHLGGNAAGGGNSHCSWVSIRRVDVRHPEEETDCQEIVCLFMGGVNPESNHVRSRFLADLKNMIGGVHLFGKGGGMSDE